MPITSEQAARIMELAEEFGRSEFMEGRWGRVDYTGKRTALRAYLATLTEKPDAD